MTPARRLPLVLMLLSQALLLAQEPPARLFFGETTIQRRVRLAPPLTAVSGNYRLQLVEVDHVSAGSEPGLRLLVRVTAVEGELPADLVLTGPAWATDAAGRRLLAQGYQVVADGDSQWLAIKLGGLADSLALFTAAIGPRPREEQRAVPVDLGRLGEVWRVPEVDKAVGLALSRRESSLLPILEVPPPLYRGIENTRLASEAIGEDGSFLSLRLYSLDPADDPAGWRLNNLRLQTADGLVQDWRYSRRLWRPDWGGWLGATGRDWQEDEPQAGGLTRGVQLEQVLPDSPAADAGLQAGDLLAAVDGRAIDDAFSLGELVRVTRPETVRECEVWRDGRRRQVRVTVGNRPLWPELDALEFAQAWDGLQALYPDGGAADRVMSLWDWQTYQPLAAGREPTGLELIFTRPEPARGTTFLFTDVPTGTGNG